MINQVKMDVPECMEIEEKQGMTTGQKVLAVGGAVLTGIAGYKLGKAVEFCKISRGLQKVWDVDPSLKDHMWEAVGKAQVIYGVNRK